MYLNNAYSETHIDDDYATNSTHVSKCPDLHLKLQPAAVVALEWDWEYEQADRKKEAKADTALHGSIPFHVDRKVLKDVVREKMGVDVGRITFLSAGTFHKAYLITLVNRAELVARVARRFMPRLKTASEVATMAYMREHTDIPVPVVYHYDDNPYNRLGGEYILMSKAPGIPLAKVFHTMSYNEMVKLCSNLASLIILLFSHRFPQIGSLYSGPNPRIIGINGSSVPTPKAMPSSSAMSMSTLSLSSNLKKEREPEFHVGPIVSWPFFGSNRGELLHPSEINRGPWSSTRAYLASCAEREVAGVVRENEGRSAPHKLHLDPDEIRSSWHHQIKAVPGDESDDSDEWDLEESEEEWEGPGDVMYRDYRRMQRTTFLVAHLAQREAQVKTEMARWTNLMGRLSKMIKTDEPEVFGLDCHDLNLENVFVDSQDPTKITCIIDWESTTTRPLWACAHLPAFLQSSPFTARLFRQSVANIADNPSAVKLPTAVLSSTTSVTSPTLDLGTLAKEWLYYEEQGTRLRLAHRFAEWDGWEEGLIDSMLGPEEMEDEWFRDSNTSDGPGDVSPPFGTTTDLGSISVNPYAFNGFTSAANDILARRGAPAATLTQKPRAVLPFVKEKDKEKMLNTTGDICGGRGGELGIRLEAWLTVCENGVDEKRWTGDGEDHE